MSPTQNRKRETLYLNKGEEKQIKKGFPWIFKNQISNVSTLMILDKGEVVNIADSSSNIIATAYANSNSELSARVLEFKKYSNEFDVNYFKYKISQALKRRQKYYSEDYYRLVFSESDFLPGLIVDRFGDTLSIQISTAGMEQFLPLIIEALEQVLSPENIILRNDVPSREKEGLELYTKVIKGTIPQFLEVHENNITYLADLQNGQKTGWFYDMRENRALLTKLAIEVKAKNMLDCFCYTGGFGLLAAKNNIEVAFVDGSKPALDIAAKAAEKNSLKNITYIHSDVNEALKNYADNGKKFDVIILDPPPYAKSKANINAAESGYKKLLATALPLINENGIIFFASCSYNAPMPFLRKIIESVIKKSGYTHTILHQTHASPDHPVLPAIPQTNYLAAITFRVNKKALD